MKDFFPPQSLATGLLIGAGAALLVPIAACAAAGLSKTLLKCGIKGGVAVSRRTRQAINDARHCLSGIADEARAEIEAERRRS